MLSISLIFPRGDKRQHEGARTHECADGNMRVFSIKQSRGRSVSKGSLCDNLANFLSISPNQTLFLPSVCLVPCGLFCHYRLNLCSQTYILSDFKVAKWAVSSLTHCSNHFQVNMFISRFMIQILYNILNVQEGKRHQKKRDIKFFISFQICVVTNLSVFG